MKKVFLIFAALGMLSFACPDNSTRITWDCGSACFSMRVQLTGLLDVDAGIAANNGLRKPTLSEAIAIGNYLNDQCD